jgi:hypothetical protein
VRHTQENPCTALFVVSNIMLEQADDGIVTATGGKHHCHDPWRLGDGTLTPLGFRYQVPAKQADTVFKNSINWTRGYSGGGDEESRRA